MSAPRDHNQGRAPTRLPGGPEAPPHAVPEARIHRPRMARGPRRLADHWVLEFDALGPKDLDPLTGWTSSADPFAPVRLRFDTLSAAVEHAERMGWRCRVEEPAPAWPRAATLRHEMASMLERARQANAAPRGIDEGQRVMLRAAAERALPPPEDAGERMQGDDRPPMPDPLDIALEETFPASDPPAPVNPTLVV